MLIIIFITTLNVFQNEMITIRIISNKNSQIKELKERTEEKNEKILAKNFCDFLENEIRLKYFYKKEIGSL